MFEMFEFLGSTCRRYVPVSISRSKRSIFAEISFTASVAAARAKRQVAAKERLIPYFRYHLSRMTLDSETVYFRVEGKVLWRLCRCNFKKKSYASLFLCNVVYKWTLSVRDKSARGTGVGLRFGAFTRHVKHIFNCQVSLLLNDQYLKRMSLTCDIII